MRNLSLTYAEKIPKVLAGTCDSTIRELKGEPRKVGERFYIHGWQGAPRRSPWSWKMLVEAYMVSRIDLHREGVRIYGYDGSCHLYEWYELNWLAAIEGFEPPNGLTMLNFFEKHYSLRRWKSFEWIRFRKVKNRVQVRLDEGPVQGEVEQGVLRSLQSEVRERCTQDAGEGTAGVLEEESRHLQAGTGGDAGPGQQESKESGGRGTWQ
jgi:hypothetical protein